MIKGKVIKFGYGDVGVGSSKFGSFISLTNIKPPQKVGDALLKKDNIEYGEQIKISICDYKLYELFKTVNENNRIIKYKEYTFDFSNYNSKSVDICIENAHNAVNMMALAC